MILRGAVCLSLVCVLVWSDCADASTITVGPNGIASRGLRLPDGTVLSGDGIDIGQVETARVPKRSIDDDASSNGFVSPTETTTQGGVDAEPNEDISSHALAVAGIMIGKGDAPESVSPNAEIYSSGFVTAAPLNQVYSDVLITTQYVAKKFTQESDQQIRVVNHSWGELGPSSGAPDGNSLVTQGLDWIAQESDVLNVVSGVQDSSLFRVPSDNYNGVTVARSELVGGVYLKVEAGNDNTGFNDAAGDRVSVDLLAPGVNVSTPNAGVTNPTAIQTGTSFAAPHVTGTVALLHEFAAHQIGNSVPRWDATNSRRHEVAKAVLLNSADKLAGVHGSRRTVLDEGNNSLTASEAYMDDTISLDNQMGAGHLNAARALRQYRSGEYNPNETAPAIGWDFGESAGAGFEYRYPISITQAGYIAATLAWDRPLDKTNDAGTADTYAFGDMFSETTFPNFEPLDLDLHIVEAGEPNVDGFYELRSVSSVDNVEHIFDELDPGNYEIVVTHLTGDAPTNYGLAWWTGSSTPTDFNNDGDVDATDLSAWESNFGSYTGDADADFEGDTDGADFLAWQRTFGTTSLDVTASPIPEPTALASVLVDLGATIIARASARHRRLGSIGRYS